MEFPVESPVESRAGLHPPAYPSDRTYPADGASPGPQGQPGTGAEHPPATGPDRGSRELDEAAARRDSEGRGRDQAADERDSEAQHLDRVSQLWEAFLCAPGRAEQVPEQVLAPELLQRLRQVSAQSRRRAAQDRRAAAAERREAAVDRDLAGADRRARVGERAGAAVDGLTGVYRRDSGFARLTQELARANRTHQSLAVAFVDVDGLKATNDRYGHLAGDRRLRAVAEVLKAHLRPYDLVFRYGGDEFVCALTGLTSLELAKRFASVNQVLADAHQSGPVTVGLAELQPGDAPTDVIARADRALYQQRARRTA